MSEDVVSPIHIAPARTRTGVQLERAAGDESPDEPRVAWSWESARDLLTLGVFAATLFVNAALLFVVEPMFTKMVLPLLGGTPSVWNSCLLFFQVVLLLGYLYAHFITKWVPANRQLVVHVALLVVSLLALPIAVPHWTPPAESMPVPWLIALLAAALGVPFLMLSSGAPLLQRWFTRTGHPSADNPYFLYAASNLGSMLALISYPLLIEPNLRLAVQREMWSGWYRVLIALVAACAVLAWRGARARARADGDAGEASAEPEVKPIEEARPIALAQRVRWVLLSFAPSSLLLGVTSFMQVDLAAVPLLWVVPLALYLLTFVLVFSRDPLLPHRTMVRLQPAIVLALTAVMFTGSGGRITQLAPIHLLAFFVTAMVCHGELAESRPPASHLTEFYLWISVGGMLGGLFNVLIAPNLFDSVLEYPIALILAVALRPTDPSRRVARYTPWLDVALPIVFGLVIVAVMKAKITYPSSWGSKPLMTFTWVMATVALLFRWRPIRLALTIAAFLVAGAVVRGRDDTLLLQARDFFAVYRVKHLGDYNVLMNGTTTHGAQALAADRRTEPLTYYHRQGLLGQTFAALLDQRQDRRVALVGLGTGTIACYGRPGEKWTFYEIDPLIERIARTPRYFTYLRDCPPTTTVVLGDARLRLASAPDSAYDLILLDAFSSDAIPMHLLTREALRLYLRKLKPDGIIAFHISNRYVDLRPVLSELARDAKLAGVVGDDEDKDEWRQKMWYTSRWVMLARSAVTLAPLAKGEDWEVLPPKADVRLWTDDFSDIWSVFRW